MRPHQPAHPRHASLPGNPVRTVPGGELPAWVGLRAAAADETGRAAPPRVPAGDGA